MGEFSNELRLSYKFDRLNKDMTKYFNKKLKSYNVTRSEVSILFIVKAEERISQAQLSKVLEVNEATTTRALTRLKKKNFVEIVVSEKDKRKKIVALTKEGKTVCEKILKHQEEFKKNLFEDFTEEDLENLDNSIDKIQKNYIRITNNEKYNKE